MSSSSPAAWARRSPPAAPIVLIVSPDVDSLIYTIRGRRVMLDADLARIYGVPTKRLNEQVRRNLKRFPDDFMSARRPVI